MEANDIKVIKTMLDNIEWHIKTNRKTLGDKEVLNQVQASLNKTITYIERKHNLT